MCLWLTSFHVPVACTQRHLHPLCTRSPTYTYPRPKVASYRKPKPAPSSSAIHLVNLVNLVDLVSLVHQCTRLLSAISRNCRSLLLQRPHLGRILLGSTPGLRVRG